ncbi:aspartate kinase [Amphiplicatus metriothermophilus]|uniref:aspartate kinase n=1 Tax=Amphiplicatus metriothermophilus TaxID=1519374 RepID=A0A239PKI8_9PROT|nr:aspartate kinase [Amphiplicatus metriothermophilus]MBB5517833.1 aspartate kinase [Amphiplicatus metriothermophilus]SNT67833.1 aspartate kinase [Amphiplicatus metriothermophilus]
MTLDKFKGEHTVEKVGGTSMAAADALLDNVLIGRRKGDELYNRVFVVSAYAGVTNKLLEDKKSGEPGVYALFSSAETEWAWGDALSEAGELMRKINADIFGDHADRQSADAFVRDRIEGVRSCLLDLHRLCSYGQFRLNEHLETVREMLAALGEAHSAHNTALLLRQKGVNATFVDLTGWRDTEHLSLDDRIVAALDRVDPASELPILTGYAQCDSGMVRRFGRGYTEVTFSRVAVLTGAREAIIHKEFHLSSADPKIAGADKVRKIGRTNYDVADQLSNMGMEAIHPRAAKGLRQAAIPLRVKNTFDPKDEGTVITSDYVSKTPRTEIITGLKSVMALEFFEQDMVGEKGYDSAILDALKRHNARIVSKISNANTITHYLECPLKTVKRVVSDLQEKFPSAAITTRKVAIVSAIGSDLKVPGLTAAASRALAEAGVETLGLHQLMRHVDIQFVVDESDFTKSVKALHRALVEKEDEIRSPRNGDAKEAA